MSGFNNDVLGGQSTLIRAAIRSPNFVQNVSGWSINKDGSAQFNNLVITSGTINGTNYVLTTLGLFFYTGTPANGNPPIDYITGPTVTQDPFSNTLPSVGGGFATARYSGGVAQALIQIASGSISLYAGPAAGYNSPASLAVSAADSRSLIITGAGISPFDIPGFLALVTQQFGGTVPPYLQLANSTTLLVGTTTPPITTAAAEIQGAIATVLASSGLTAFSSQVTGDTFTRFSIDDNGLMHWGTGAAASDVSLFREGVGFLGTNSILALQNRPAGTPASITGFSELYSDSFTQLHSDRAFVSDVNVETKNQGSPPGAGGSGAKLYTTTGHQQVVSGQTGIGGDTLSYDVEKLTLDISADTASLTNTAATNIPGMSTKTVQAHKYKLRAYILINQGAAAGTVTVNFAGPAVGSGGMGNSAVDNSNVNAVSQTAGLGTVTFTQTNVGRTTLCILEGVVTFSASGSVSVQTRTSAAGDPYTVKAGSYWQLEPITAT